MAKSLKWTSHPLTKDTVLQQISSNPSAEGCCVPRSNSPIPPWAGFRSKEALEEFIEEYIDKCACYYDRDKICEDCEIVRAIRGCDSEAALELGSERLGREMLRDLKREKGLYAEQTQVGIYEAAPEEGASMTQTPLTEGSPPGICIQARNKVRQRYLVSEEQGGVASRPPGAARERPVNYPWEEQHFVGSPHERREKMSESFW